MLFFVFQVLGTVKNAVVVWIGIMFLHEAVTWLQVGRGAAGAGGRWAGRRTGVAGGWVVGERAAAAAAGWMVGG